MSAGVTGEVEVDGYGGRTSGGWVCGPMGSVQYGGAAVKASLSERDINKPEGQNEGQGTVASLTGAFDVESLTVINAPNPDPAAEPIEPAAPRSSVLIGAQASAGYRWKWIGIEGGLGFYEAWRDADSAEHETVPVPNVELSFGLRNKAYGVLGGGSPLATSVLRPGIYTGGGYVLDNKVAFDLRVGMYRQGPGTLETAGLRLDLGARGPLSDTISIRVGGNVGFHDDATLPLDFEGSAGLIFGY